MSTIEDFYQLERPIILLKEQIDVLGLNADPGAREKIAALRLEIEREWAKIYPDLTPSQIVQIARHPKRPYTLDYINLLMQDFMEIHGDRRFADDPAVVAGFAFYKGETVAVIGHQKGRTTRERIDRNFGQMNPEGYRKVLRVVKMAEKFGFPVISLIDTPGAYPGIGAEERGQAEAIAHNLKVFSMLRVPIVIVVIGEGGSGGALGIGIGDSVSMLENSFYSVISPEGCAAILWKDQNATKLAAEAMKIRSRDLFAFGIIDEIIPEPPGGAHIDAELTIRAVDEHLSRKLAALKPVPKADLLEARYRKFRKMGTFTES
jgi:acetyl-CoA carboxylase carboxyl transferase subunit alpha